MDPVFPNVRAILHSFVTNEAAQFENIANQKPRTDSGYTANLNEAAAAVIKAVRDHDGAHA